jgi:hypothetical protein
VVTKDRLVQYDCVQIGSLPVETRILCWLGAVAFPIRIIEKTIDRSMGSKDRTKRRFEWQR